MNFTRRYLDISAQQLRVQPSLLKQAKGLEAVFHCPYNQTGLRSFVWALNGLEIAPLSPPSGVSLGPAASSLIIQTTLQYNNTIVQCIATRTMGEDLFSENATLVVLGQLSHLYIYMYICLSCTEGYHDYINYFIP